MNSMNQNLGIITHDKQALHAVLAAMALDGTTAEPVKVPQGKLGGCVACQQAVAAHFRAGAWVGCPEGGVDTVFVLVPASLLVRGKALETRHATVKADVAVSHETATVEEPPEQTRGFKRARYFSTLRSNASIETLPLSDTRKKVLRIIHKTGKQGIRAKAIMSRGKLPHGTVQQTLNWLRTQAKPLVEAREDGSTAKSPAVLPTRRTPSPRQDGGGNRSHCPPSYLLISSIIHLRRVGISSALRLNHADQSIGWTDCACRGVRAADGGGGSQARAAH